MSNFVGLYVRVTTADGLKEGLVTKVENGMLSLSTQNGPIMLSGAAIKNLKVIEKGETGLQLPDPRSLRQQPQSQQPHQQQQYQSTPPAPAPPASSFGVNNLFAAHRAETNPAAPSSSAPAVATSDDSLSDQELVAKMKALNRRKKKSKDTDRYNHNNSNNNRGGADWETDTSFTGDFDFAANLQKFDKQQVFDEIRESDTVPVEQRLVSHNRKYDFAHNAGKVPHHEMVLQPVQRQRWVEDERGDDDDEEGDDDRVTKLVLPDGVTCPTASADQYADVMRLVTPFMPQLIENCGSRLAELVIRLSGGPARFGSSSNHNPLPLCVCHVTDSDEGRKALSAASHLSNHGLKVVALLEKPRDDYSADFELKFNFFELCYGKIAASIKEYKDLARKNKLAAAEIAIVSGELTKPLQSVFDSKTTIVCIDHDVSAAKAVLVSSGIPLEASLQSEHTHYLIDMGLPQKVFEIERFKELAMSWGAEWFVQLDRR